MKPKGLSELCAVTSDLVIQTGIGIEKNRPFDHPQAELDILSFQKTYKWAMETRGPKSNSSELLCLSWLPGTLVMIRSKMNELAWRHNFPTIRLMEGKSLDIKGS